MSPEAATALTIRDFCDKYRIHRVTFYRNARRGLMPRTVKIGSSTRILAEDVDAWLEAQRASSQDEKQGSAVSCTS